MVTPINQSVQSTHTRHLVSDSGMCGTYQHYQCVCCTRACSPTLLYTLLAPHFQPKTLLFSNRVVQYQPPHPQPLQHISDLTPIDADDTIGWAAITPICLTHLRMSVGH